MSTEPSSLSSGTIIKLIKDGEYTRGKVEVLESENAFLKSEIEFLRSQLTQQRQEKAGFSLFWQNLWNAFNKRFF